jgi:hypothetical protein
MPLVLVMDRARRADRGSDRADGPGLPGESINRPSGRVATLF